MKWGNPMSNFSLHRKHKVAATISITVLLVLSAMVFAADPVKTDGGLLQGTVEDGLRIYRGIPYAAPPIGDLRWKAPQSAAKWDGVKPANHFGRACIQTNAAIRDLPAPSEDCLYLNVWTPAASASENLAVMVWIHGGGFTAGTPAEKTYHGEWLAKKGVVVVSIGYRLGVMGFLAHPTLSTENTNKVSGNYGLLDMVAGLKWVQNNIAKFGGNPKRVTIFGESAGSAAVSVLCASSLAKGLFHSAIAQSGSSFAPVRANAGLGDGMNPLSAAEKSGADWAKKQGDLTIEELRKISAEKLQAASQGQAGIAAPNVDGYVIADDQYKLYLAGKYNDVPVIVGYNSDEGATFGGAISKEAYVENTRGRFGPLADKILAIYPGGNTPIEKRTARNLMRDSSFGSHSWAWVRLQTRTGKSKAYFYFFDVHPDYPADSQKAGVGAAHAAELPYTFHQLGPNPNHSTPVTPEDEKMSDMMRSYWTNFAKTGDPNGPGLPKWAPYDDKAPRQMRFTFEGTKMSPVANESGLKVLDEYFAWRRSEKVNASAIGK
jgi:para-nitrobenzyl esterase